jgi:Tol biopolymer transport system component
VANGGLKLLADYGMVSHCFWVDNKTVLAYFRNSDAKDSYWLLDIETGTYNEVFNGSIEDWGDGHPHVHGDWFITDTYPDKARMQHLILVNWKTGNIKELGKFFHGFKYVEKTRCDLHPRFSPDGKCVFFDSVFSGKRQFYKMYLDL